MPERVSCRLYLLLNALENFDIFFQLISKKIQPTGNTHCHNILYLSHNNPYFPYIIAITNFTVLHTC